MVCSADDSSVWKDFPKGLRVLLLDEDRESAAETKMKLEAMDYIVYSYCNEEDALEAILRKAEIYHIAIVEVTIDNGHGSIKFLEMVKDLPTIVTSKFHCLNTVMKCIALGAAEFLQKPVSEDKLRNIWQHVVHKAFSAGGHAISRSLKPIKETVASMLQVHSNSSEFLNEIPSQVLNIEQELKLKNENKAEEQNDKSSETSTPQVINGGRLEKDGEFQQLTDCWEKGCAVESKELAEIPKGSLSETKFVDNTCYSVSGALDSDEALPSIPGEAKTEEGFTSSEDVSLHSLSTQNAANEESDLEDLKKKKPFLLGNSCLGGNRGNRRKMKVDWTPELHRRFVQAVEQLGIDHAIPSKILELMKVDCLTRHNVASHLQKFRMHRRHILPKDADRIWQAQKVPTLKGYMQKPIVAFPSYHSNYCIPPSQVYPIWPHATYHLPNVQMWGNSRLPTWHPPHDNWHWKTYPEIHADAWGCPVLPHYCYGQFYTPPQGPAIMNNYGLDANVDRGGMLKSSYDLCPAEVVIDKVVKEAMSKPWLPLPLGLKPPSTDDVLAELHRQGINTIPPLLRYQN